jgi:Cu/Ag efflux pump CusA
MALITIIGLILFISITCIFIGWRFKMENMMLGGIVVTLVVMVASMMIIVDNGVKIWQLLS